MRRLRSAGWSASGPTPTRTPRGRPTRWSASASPARARCAAGTATATASSTSTSSACCAPTGTPARCTRSASRRSAGRRPSGSSTAEVRPARGPGRQTARVPDAPPLTVRGLMRSYGRLVGLDALDLDLARGECVAIIGANGSGKSTAVRTISGLLEPTAGTVAICGHDPHVEPEAELARAALALVPDAPLLYDDLTVRQHLDLVALAHGVSDDGTPARIDALLERLGLAARADFLPAELSRGMRQKAGLACALIRPAALMILDEPVVGLDPPSQALLAELLVEAKAGGTAILLTTHQMYFADGVADRAIVLGEGVVLDQGPWREVRERAAAQGWLPDEHRG